MPPGPPPGLPVPAPSPAGAAGIPGSRLTPGPAPGSRVKLPGAPPIPDDLLVNPWDAPKYQPEAIRQRFTQEAAPIMASLQAEIDRLKLKAKGLLRDNLAERELGDKVAELARIQAKVDERVSSTVLKVEEERARWAKQLRDDLQRAHEDALRAAELEARLASADNNTRRLVQSSDDRQQRQFDEADRRQRRLEKRVARQQLDRDISAARENLTNPAAAERGRSKPDQFKEYLLRLKTAHEQYRQADPDAEPWDPFTDPEKLKEWEQWGGPKYNPPKASAPARPRPSQPSQPARAASTASTASPKPSPEPAPTPAPAGGLAAADLDLLKRAQGGGYKSLSREERMRVVELVMKHRGGQTWAPGN